jgi:beta-xylosidase
MRALEGFHVTATYCFTPEHKGQWPHYTAVPTHPEEFAAFCAAMTRRYAPGRADASAQVMAPAG